MTGDAVIVLRIPLTEESAVTLDVTVADVATEVDEPVKLLRDGVGDGDGDLIEKDAVAVDEIGDP